VNSSLTDDFVSLFRALPARVRKQARKTYRLWKRDPSHPSLHFKRVHTSDPIYSVRIGKGWRVLGLKEAGGGFALGAERFREMLRMTERVESHWRLWKGLDGKILIVILLPCARHVPLMRLANQFKNALTWRCRISRREEQ
jgi:hypothetical protein